jgi:hypothetical protein
VKRPGLERGWHVRVGICKGTLTGAWRLAGTQVQPAGGVGLVLTW